MKGYVYLLLSQKDGRTYTGSTDNLERRLEEHNTGKNISTKYRSPFTLIYQKEYSTLDEARKAERYLKTKSGRKELKKILESL
jgi:putative endonuclease